MTLPTSMFAILLTGHGGPEMLEVHDDVPVPIPGPGEVLIRVSAAGVNNTDINTRSGWYAKDDANGDDGTWSGDAMDFPRIQGADVCGVVAAVGDGVDKARIGERVLVEPSMPRPRGESSYDIIYFGSECDGGFAQFTVAPARHACTVDCDLTDAELASFPCSYSTAENMIHQAGVNAGDAVLVTGASGGVGSAAIQLARRRGARVTAVAGAAKSNAVFNLGADSVIPRGSRLADALGPESIDVVIDLVAGSDWPDLITVLKRGGRYAVAGAIGGPMVQLDVRSLYLKDLKFYGCTVLLPDVFPNLIGYIERGEIRPLVAETYPMADIADAQAAFATKKHVGKLVLIPPPITDA